MKKAPCPDRGETTIKVGGRYLYILVDSIVSSFKLELTEALFSRQFNNFATVLASVCERQ
jgi:hypothetical protein